VHSDGREIGLEPAGDDRGAALDTGPFGALEVTVGARWLLDGALGAAAGAVRRVHGSKVAHMYDKIVEARRGPSGGMGASARAR
jgi:hypothetical protein